MKKLLVAVLVLMAAPAQANEQGGWVKVDANNNVISGTIVCTPDVCGDVNSPYAKATLNPGERYVQITKADTNGNVAGPNVTVAPAPNTTVVAKADPVKNEVKITTVTTEPFAPKTNVVKETVQTFNAESSNPVIEVKAPTLQITEEPATIVEDTEFLTWLAMVKELFAQLSIDWNLAFSL